MPDGDDRSTPAAGTSPDGGDDLLRAVARIEAVPPPKYDPLRPGARLSQFEVISELGRGGMGIVYLAEDTRLRRRVALKVLPTSVAEDDERKRRLLREARAAGAVSHPNIAAVHEVGESDGRVYVAMEHVDGESLRSRMTAGTLAVTDALEIAAQVLRGLGAAHAAGLVHRDLKPDNVMIARDGLVKVLDFGLATRKRDEAVPTELADTTLLTSEGRVLGTPAYMSPEQAVGDSVDGRSDLFSFGVMLYEMLVGRRPFEGRTPSTLIAAILAREPEPPAAVRPEIGEALSHVVMRCLAKDPAERYPDAGGLAHELARAQRTRSEAGRRLGAVARPATR